MYFNRNSGALEEFSFTVRLFGSKMQKITFLKKMSVLSTVFFFIKFEYGGLQTQLVNLKNTQNISIFAYDRFLLI